MTIDTQRIKDEAYFGCAFAAYAGGYYAGFAANEVVQQAKNLWWKAEGYETTRSSGDDGVFSKYRKVGERKQGNLVDRVLDVASIGGGMALGLVWLGLEGFVDKVYERKHNMLHVRGVSHNHVDMGFHWRNFLMRYRIDPEAEDHDHTEV